MSEEEKQPLLLNTTEPPTVLLRDDMVNGLDKTRTADLNVNRPIYQQEDLNRHTLYERPQTTFLTTCGKSLRQFQVGKCLWDTIPVLQWLPKYQWKRHFLGDIISGITVAIMHIPQGMAYALLGGVPPVVGIYMAFFPVLIYFLFGTSRHVSIGTFAIVCLMTGKVVNQFSTVEILQNGTEILSVHGIEHPELPDLTNIEVAVTVTFVVAMIQLIMYSLHLGVVSTLLSETLVNGFTCASAWHVIGSQLKDLFGLTALTRRNGNFSFLYTLYDAGSNLSNANGYACAITAVTCLILIVNNEVLKPLLAKKTRIPFPIELMAVVIGTVISWAMDLERNYGITTIGKIPTGLPKPIIPEFSLVPDILLDGFVITMVSYTITMSMALIFARKLMYEVDANQELLALGVSNVFGTFFSCMPVTASLSRSMIQQAVGGVTQLASIVSCLLLLVILLWIGPFFESLPRCVLASIIVVALKGMLLQCKSIGRYWKLSKWDGTVWLVTFFTTLLLQISIGLAAGVAISLLSIFVQGYQPYTCLLGTVPNTDLYLDLRRFRGVRELPNIKIFHYSGGLSFASRANFKESLGRRVGFDATVRLRHYREMEEQRQNVANERQQQQYDSDNDKSTMSSSRFDIDTLCSAQCVILDFAALTFVDPSGVDLLRQLLADYHHLNIVMYITGCSGPVYEMITKCERYEGFDDSHFAIFPTIHDAVLYAQKNVINVKN